MGSGSRGPPTSLPGELHVASAGRVRIAFELPQAMSPGSHAMEKRRPHGHCRGAGREDCQALSWELRRARFRELQELSPAPPTSAITDNHDPRHRSTPKNGGAFFGNHKAGR